MVRKGHTPEQIINKLREAEYLSASPGLFVIALYKVDICV